VKLAVRTPGEPCTGEATAAIAVAAEALGFDSLWASEHTVHPVRVESRYPLADGNYRERLDRAFPEMTVALAYAAAVTKTIRLGTAVIPIVTRHPLFLAKQVSTLDALSGGRLELGLGTGWMWEEAIALGQPYDRANDRLAETIEILRGAWRDLPYGHDGEFWSFEPVAVLPQPVQGDRVPLWIGGSSNAAVRIARSKGAGLLLAGFGPAAIAEVRERAGPDVPIGTMVWLGDGRLVFRDGGGEAAELTAELEATGTDLLVATVAAGTAPEVTIAELERFMDAVRMESAAA
jgi:probable F420-dependent oxidoreductase